ncbi:efflux RND transporter permease subunit [Allorhodopirellula heiligendammensis]|uniref:Cation efflux system protein CusA n=1 Tax=Allorhodopirellula heiligendammensis TaxID=2714739 RepID=A0A5C6BSC3_9BACT|nr:efflux RND transporter permease subunit [Allorhodopirellula heiligendammensis]TWU15140.1 Cation efflux system protein CusA [Allorhodopirellula heiligendammensis]
MLNLLIRFCVKEPWLVVLLAIAASVGGYFAFQAVPIDAIPNVGENQVIVLTPWPGRSPKDIEDQVTYPLSVSLLAVPGAESVRGKSMFGYSFVQVTFKDEIDFYWARSRVSEQIGSAASQLPDGVVPQLGPDATGLGQIYYYTLQPPKDGMSLAELRSMQDFVIKFELQAVEGVSEVASIGGYIRQYQVEVDPDKLRYHNVPLDKLATAIKASNVDVGAKTVETTGMEFIVRGKGFLGTGGEKEKAISDIEDTVILQRGGVPIRVRDVARVQLGPDFRRGALDYNGSEAVGGVVVMRYGENPRVVIERIKDKIAAITPALNGVRIHGVYDRSGLIDETMATLTHALRDEIIITAIIILLFLMHIRTSFVVAICLPAAVLMSFIAMHLVGVGSNIMSLAGIAIAIGTMVDMGIIVSENIYQHLADWEREETERGSPADMARERQGDAESSGSSISDLPVSCAPPLSAPPLSAPRSRSDVVYEATIEVAPAVVTAVATTIVSFLPVFFLTGRDYRLFSPLAYTKTFAIAAAMITAVTIVPALSRLLLKSASYRKRTAFAAGVSFGCLLTATSYFMWGDDVAAYLGVAPWVITAATGPLAFFLGWQLLRERIRPIEEIPSSRFVHWLYAARLKHALHHKVLALSFPAILLLIGVGAFFGLPTVLQPVERLARVLGAELNEFPGYVDAKHVFTGLQSDDWIALDEGSWFYMPTLYPAASFSQAMQVLQTQDVLIGQIPEVKDVLGKIGRVESALDPAPAAMVETYVMLKPESEWREGVTSRDIWDEINRVATLPGVTPASALQPIEGRVVMLQSGIKASMAIRIYGDDLSELASAAIDVAAILKKLPLVNAGTVNPDIVMGKPYIEFTVDRNAASRYGMSAEMVNEVIETALGGMNLIKTVEGRERYPVRLRYNRELRERVDQLTRLPVVTNSGAVVPLEELAQLETTWGPGAINSENGRLVAHVAFMTSGAKGDLESVAAIEEQLRLAQLASTDEGRKERGGERQSTRRGDRGTRFSGDTETRETSPVRPLSLSATSPVAEPLSLDLPAGYSLEAVGSFRNQIEANLRLMWIIPLVILINLLLIYFEFRNLPIAMAVFTGIPVAFAGGMVLVAWMQVELNTAVWVGFIALFGLAVDDGVVMATYIHQLLRKRRITNVQDIRETVYEAGLKRIRPCMMTTVTTLAALIPVLLATGRGADVARAMAIPVFGGMLAEPFTSFIVPTLYSGYLEMKMRFGMHDELWEGTEEMPQEGLTQAA